MCAKRLFDGPLCCDNPAPEPHTHTYSASDAPDNKYEPSEGDH